MFLNNQYIGLYGVAEPVDRKQLKLKKYNDTDGIRGELYKGLTYNLTKFYGSPSLYDNNELLWGGFEYKHPEEKIDWSTLYDFADFVVSSSNKEFYSSYYNWFYSNNLVDYYLFLNLMMAIDNNGPNIFIAKYKENEPYFYVPWDLDGSFGLFYYGGKTNFFNITISNGLFDRLILDDSENGFNAKLKQKWVQLRSDWLTMDGIVNLFKENVDYLQANNVYERENLAWDDFSYNSDNLVYLQEWTKNRIEYLDQVFKKLPTGITDPVSHTSSHSIQIYPNPAQDYLYFNSHDNFTISIYSLEGRFIQHAAINSGQNKFSISHLENGIYIIHLQNENMNEFQKIVVRKP